MSVRVPVLRCSGPRAGMPGFSTSAPDKLYFPVDTENGKVDR